MSNRDWLDKDFYSILGVRLTASEVDIKKAYRELARKYHPDLNPGDALAEKRFKDVAQAYDVLSSRVDRGRYDIIRRTGGGRVMGRRQGGFARHVNLGVHAPPAFIPPRPGNDLRKDVIISSRDARRGMLVNLQAVERGMPTRTVILFVPPGTADGTEIRLKGRGGFGIAGGPSGDLLVNVKVLRTQRFGARNDDSGELRTPEHGQPPFKLKHIPGAVKLVAHVLINPNDVELNETLRRYGEEGMPTYARQIIRQRRGKD